MKYLSLQQIHDSLRKLKDHNPIFGITYLVLKKANIPVGNKVVFNLDPANEDFLKKYYRVHPKSDYFFKVLRQRSRKGKDWVAPKYASTGLQSMNTRNYKDIFLHDNNQNVWGFSENYINELKKALPKNKKLPLFHLAVWIYRDEGWNENVKRKDILNTFIERFHITQKEIEVLFDLSIASSIDENDAFQQLPVKWYQILENYNKPPDIQPEQSGILFYWDMHLTGLSPIYCGHSISGHGRSEPLSCNLSTRSPWHFEAVDKIVSLDGLMSVD